MSPSERKKEVVDVCLKTFMARGLSHTSTKDLCDALKLNSGGVFWYFKTKDDIVIACAEEAKKRIETDLIGSALKNIDNPDKLEQGLYERATEMRPLMQFFVTVCSLPKYRDRIEPILTDLSIRYRHYNEKFAEKLKCSPDDVAPYVYIVINTMLSYMLFGYEKHYYAPQIPIVKKVLVDFLANRDKLKEKRS